MKNGSPTGSASQTVTSSFPRHFCNGFVPEHDLLLHEVIIGVRQQIIRTLFAKRRLQPSGVIQRVYMVEEFPWIDAFRILACELCISNIRTHSRNRFLYT